MRYAVDPWFPEPEILDVVERGVRNGLLLLFPTETVYGLGTLYSDVKNIQKIFQLKSRPADKPIALMFPTVHRALDFLQPAPLAREVLRVLLPNPITLIVRKSPGVGLSTYLTNPHGEVGVRVPDHPFPLSIATLFRIPLAVTSANLSGAAEPTTPREISVPLYVDEIFLDAGPTRLRRPSTVVRVDEETRTVHIQRVGAFPPDKIEEEVKKLGANTDIG